MSETRLAAELRSEFGKGGARRTRRAGKIPAVIYGHGADPRHVALPSREFTAAIRHNGVNVLLTLDLEGGEQLVIPKAIQRHAIKGTYDHVDLLAVKKGEKLTVDVPVVVVGDLIAGGLLAQDASSVSVEAEATHLPSEIEVDITGVEIGSQITAADLLLPSGTTLVSDPETLIVVINDAAAAAASAEAAEAAEGAEAGEGAEAEAAEAEAPAAEAGEGAEAGEAAAE